MGKPDLETFADQRDQAKYEENQQIARTARTLRADAARAKEQAAEIARERDAAEKALSLYEHKYADRPAWLAPPKKSGPVRGTLVAFLSDTHYGEVVRSAEVGGYNKYDTQIAEQRTQRFFSKTVEMARSYFAGVKYDGIVLALGGDIVSGDIHDELAQTNEQSTHETILWAVPRLSAGVEMLRKEFGQVHVVSAPGNHGRDSRKPRYKGRSAHNADTLIARLMAQQFAQRDGVTFEVPETIDVNFAVYRWRFSLEHGDELRFNGTSEIGSLGPIKRGTMRKQTQMQAEGKPFDYLLLGHFHQYVPAASQGFIANGTLKGFDEYARGRKFKPEPPQQAIFIVDPDHGVTLQAPLFVA